METQKKWMTVVGWILTLLPLAAFLPSAAFKFMDGPEFMKGWNESGYSASTLLPIALAETVCIILYVIPKTSVFGAILTVGYLGGAVATHVRANQAIFIVPALLGVMIWGGLFLREPRVRALIPFKS